MIPGALTAILQSLGGDFILLCWAWKNHCQADHCAATHFGGAFYGSCLHTCYLYCQYCRVLPATGLHLAHDRS